MDRWFSNDNYCTEIRNTSFVPYFILLGVSENPLWQKTFSLIVLLIFVFILLGNLTPSLLVCSDSRLHTPMYFFLVNLSILDMSYATTTLCTVIKFYLTGDQTISLKACIAQIYLYVSFVNCEVFLLAAMSFDRYVAICNPLQYPLIMTSRSCSLMLLITFLLGFSDPLFLIVSISRLSCFKTVTVNHFFCDLRAFIQLSCNSIAFVDYLMLTEAAIFCLPSLLSTMISYLYIIRAILKICVVSGRQKAFSTCSSQLIIVILYYTIIFCLYLRPISMPTTSYDKLFTLLYTAGTPLVNPLIYSLKNEDVKSAFRRIFKRRQNY
uniref:Olfactory receptor n=1 Tax=Pyxicephalus adspersus TaxID=30357 RepID=A0AAV2ZQU9_PYXAD|nr:TPA: hypothetical protein GDO54_017494 [Pyxicephalus adspersus]